MINASKAKELSGGITVDDAATLAAAFAESGDFETVCAWQNRASEMASVEQTRHILRSRLGRYYQHNKPYREGRKT